MIRLLTLLLVACAPSQPSQRQQEKAVVDRQQQAYLLAQPVPTFDYSLERDRITQLYQARMGAVQTWSVWRSQTGMVEGDCASSGYPLPYGVQLTAPEVMSGTNCNCGYEVVPQAEPNGLFTNGITSNGTWVFCVLDGSVAPVYVEDFVTVYPYPVEVDYEANRVVRVGAATVTLEK